MGTSNVSFASIASLHEQFLPVKHIRYHEWLLFVISPMVRVSSGGNPNSVASVFAQPVQYGKFK